MMRLTLTLGLVFLLAGCAAPRETAPEAEAAGVPGFDTWRYPGDEAMQAWREASPYRWVGVYLPAPCHRETSWLGTRPRLEAMGWGTAVLYVGQQVFENAPDASPGDGPIICSRSLLTAEQARLDARDAAAKAASESYPAGTVIFLDVERVEQIPDSLRTYVRVWHTEMLADGRYDPGLYVHRTNAVALLDEALRAWRLSGRSGTPGVWVTGGSGFALNRAPDGVGLPFATVWQGVLDTERTWGGVALTVDENVARRASPSAPKVGS